MGIKDLIDPINGQELEKFLNEFLEKLNSTKNNKTFNDISQTSGLSFSVIRNYMNGESFPSVDRLFRLAKALGIQADSLIPKISAGPAIDGQHHTVKKSRPEYKISNDVIITTGTLEHDSLNTNEIGMPINPFFFKDVYTTDLNPEDLIAVICKNSSMEPTIKYNSIITIDKSIKKVTGNHIYIVDIAGNIQIKRIQINYDGGLTVSCDNPSSSQFTVPENETDKLAIFGKVIKVDYFIP